MFPAVGERLAGADSEVSDGAADEYFAGRGEAADACGDVDREAADVVICEQFTFPGVQTGAYLQAELAEAVSDRDRAADRAARTVEGGEHPVTERLDQPPTVSLHLVAHELVVFLQQRAPGSIAELSRTPGRADNVGKEDGGEHAVANDRSSHTGQELLDLIRGLPSRRDFDVAGIWDVSRGVS
jgi:hypothetical protein